METGAGLIFAAWLARQVVMPVAPAPEETLRQVRLVEPSYRCPGVPVPHRDYWPRPEEGSPLQCA